MLEVIICYTELLSVRIYAQDAGVEGPFWWIPWCLLACPTDAFHVDEAAGAKVIEEEKCSGCMLCMTACPATPKRIRYNAGKKVCLKCDLCGGDPQCVKFCPTGALTYTKA